LSKLPLLSWREVVKALNRAGVSDSEAEGQSPDLVKDDVVVPVPKHSEIKRGCSKPWPKPG